MHKHVQRGASIRCLTCKTSFISTVAYLHPSHRCVVENHPSGRKPTWMKIGLQEGTE